MKYQKITSFTLQIGVLLMLSLTFFTITNVSAVNEGAVTVSDQQIVGDKVTVDEVIYNNTGWIVIHADASGSPGQVLGYSSIVNGTNTNVVVHINTTGATNTLYAMLHNDTGTIGVFEFPGVDVPIKENGNVIAPPFDITGIDDPEVKVSNQFIVGDKVTINEVTSPGPGWLVIHADNSGAPGTVLGQTAVSHGRNDDVVVFLDTAGRTAILYAMLHADNGTRGIYEFPGADAPVSVNGSVVTPSFNVDGDVAPSVEVSDQLVLSNNVTISKVLSPGPGWLVIHADNSGAPGTVLGQTSVEHGENLNIGVTITSTGRTDVLYAMLHADNGTRGVYEFPGADAPVSVNGAVVTPAFHTQLASVTVSSQPNVGDKVTVDRVFYNSTGWIVIHADSSGSPGQILGYTNISSGLSTDVVVQINTTGATTTLYAMLHTDLGTVGAFEFPGADVPVKDNGVVIAPSFTVTATLDPSVTVVDQEILNDKVTIAKVVSPGPGWLVIHADNAGSPGTVLGQTLVKHGENLNVEVTLTTSGRTDVLYAMLHSDNGTRGVYEFPGADGPVKVGGSVVTPSFKVLEPTTSMTTETTSDTQTSDTQTSASSSEKSNDDGLPGLTFFIAIFAFVTIAIFVKRRTLGNK